MKDVTDRKLPYAAFWLAQAQGYLATEMLDKEVSDQKQDRAQYNLDSVAQGFINAINALVNYCEDNDLPTHHIDILRRMVAVDK
jgi:hypothetical protein